MSFVKILVSGAVIERYLYEKMPSNFPVSCSDSDPPPDNLPRDKNYERRQNSRRSRWRFMRLANANFESGSKFVTYTFAENLTDIREANRRWNVYLHRAYRKWGKFAWLLSTEFQERGAVHFHVLSRQPYIRAKELESIWGNGFVKVNRIDHVTNVGAYTSKYMVKDLSDTRLCSFKAWRGSVGLKKPLELRGDDARDFLEKIDLVNSRIAYETSYSSEYNGTILYTQYNLNREHGTSVKIMGEVQSG